MRTVRVQVTGVVGAQIYVGRLVCMVFAKVSFGWEEGASVELRAMALSGHLGQTSEINSRVVRVNWLVGLILGLCWLGVRNCFQF